MDIVTDAEHHDSSIASTAEAYVCSKVLRTSAISSPDSQIVGEIILSTTSKVAVVLILVDVARPLPDISRHIIKTIRAG